MPNAPLEPYLLGPWTGGVKTDLSALLATPQDLREVSNIEILYDGSIRKRRGYEKFTSNDGASIAGEHIWYWSRDGANDFVFVADQDGELYQLDLGGTVMVRANDGADITLGAGGEDLASATMNDVIYFSSSTASDQYSFNGTVWTNITDNTLDGDGSEFPRAQFLAVQHERMFAASIGGMSNDRIHWSQPADANDWEANSYIDFDPGDGGRVTGLIPYRDRLVIFKQHQVFVLAGASPDTFTVYRVSDKVGMIDSRSAAVANDLLIWYSAINGRVYAYDGTNFETIDDNIHSRLSAVATGGSTPLRVRAAAHDNLYYLFVTGEGEDAPSATFVFDAKLGQWTEYNVGLSGMVTDPQSGIHYGIAPTHPGDSPPAGVFTVWGEAEFSDNSVSFASSVRTQWWAPNQEFGLDFLLHRIQLYARQGVATPARVTLNVLANWDAATPIATYDIDTSGSFVPGGSVEYAVPEVDISAGPLQSLAFEIASNDDITFGLVDTVPSETVNDILSMAYDGTEIWAYTEGNTLRKSSIVTGVASAETNLVNTRLMDMAYTGASVYFLGQPDFLFELNTSGAVVRRLLVGLTSATAQPAHSHFFTIRVAAQKDADEWVEYTEATGAISQVRAYLQPYRPTVLDYDAVNSAFLIDHREGGTLYVVKVDNNLGNVDPADEISRFAVSGVTEITDMAFTDTTSMWICSSHERIIQQWNPTTGVKLKELSVAFDPEGLEFHSSKLWAHEGDSIHEINQTTGAIVSTISLPTNVRWGKHLAWDGTHYWISGRYETPVLVGSMSLAHAATVTSTTVIVPSGITTAANGVAYKGAKFWILDESGTVVREIDPADGSLDSTITLAAGVASASLTKLTWDGTNFWTINTATNKAVVFNTSGALVAEYTIPDGLDAIESVGGDMWLSGDGQELYYIYDFATDASWHIDGIGVITSKRMLGQGVDV